MEYIFLLPLLSLGQTRMTCERTKIPLELGNWRSILKHLDSAVIENRPVTISEGQIYVYENYFPGHSIQYIHVDNLAMRSCGASASIKSGGIGSSSVLIILHAEPNQEIRSVIEIWGFKEENRTKHGLPRNPKSLYLFSDLRAVNHNGGFW